MAQLTQLASSPHSQPVCVFCESSAVSAFFKTFKNNLSTSFLLIALRQFRIPNSEFIIHNYALRIISTLRTSVGGYVEEEPEEDNSAQFDVEDRRTLDQVINWLLKLGYIPSFCTACYREGRTGDRFMKLVKSAKIGNCCQPNALMTLKEYLEDYASPDTKAAGEKVIQEELKYIPSENTQRICTERLEKIHNGERDFRF